jgi:hypothetical protein
VETAKGGFFLVMTTLASGVLFYLAMRKRRLALVVERTPTASATRPVTGDQVEVKGKVVAEKKTFESLVPGRRAVWCHLVVEEVDDVGHDETRRTIFDDIHTAEFMVDDRSGKMARVVPASMRGGLTTKESARVGSREQVLARLKKIGVTGFDPGKLSWRETALYVGDSVYVLGHGESVEGPPEADGYRTMRPTQQLVMRGSLDAPLVIAAMTEDDYVAEVRSKAAFYVVWAIVVAVAGSVLSLLAALSSD